MSEDTSWQERALAAEAELAMYEAQVKRLDLHIERIILKNSELKYEMMTLQNEMADLKRKREVAAA